MMMTELSSILNLGGGVSPHADYRALLPSVQKTDPSQMRSMINIFVYVITISGIPTVP